MGQAVCVPLDWAAKAAAEKGDGERAPSVHTTSVQKILSLVDDLKHLKQPLTVHNPDAHNDTPYLLTYTPHALTRDT
jgi:hypothetical protein